MEFLSSEKYCLEFKLNPVGIPFIKKKSERMTAPHIYHRKQTTTSFSLSFLPASSPIMNTNKEIYNEKRKEKKIEMHWDFYLWTPCTFYVLNLCKKR